MYRNRKICRTANLTCMNKTTETVSVVTMAFILNWKQFGEGSCMPCAYSLPRSIFFLDPVYCVTIQKSQMNFLLQSNAHTARLYAYCLEFVCPSKITRDVLLLLLVCCRPIHVLHILTYFCGCFTSVLNVSLGTDPAIIFNPIGHSAW